MNTGRPVGGGRHRPGPLAPVALFLVLAAVLVAAVLVAAVLFAALPRPAPADEPAGRGDHTIVGRIADVFGDAVAAKGAAGPAPRHTREVGGPPHGAGTVSDVHPATTTGGGGTP
ncbi:hypothetical protein ABZW32_16640 [Streptomyces sp. NPDC004667]|uniref:hypothetical protein n=1 Tax=Streptomyces sp. NPDC004667 TaxID=3154285 RepID=UPI0033B085A8